jgi:hypothetical protein
LRARVRTAAADRTRRSGSARPKQPIHSPVASRGRNFWRWASVP